MKTQIGSTLSNPAQKITQPLEVLPAGPITLRRWKRALVQQLDDAVRASLPELSPFMPWATADHGLQQSREFVEKSMAEWNTGETWNYAMISDAGAVVGGTGLMTRMGPGVLEIGYWVHSAHAGLGYASAAASALAETGLQIGGVDRIVIKHDKANPASGRVAAKAGFTQVGSDKVEPKAPSETGVQLIWERSAGLGDV
ncbi:MAG: GNAT family N-acetyltransferase [Candidatus Nanopelagicales bacterium]